MDKKVYKIGGIVFEITLNSKDYKIIDLFGEPQPYSLFINYMIEEIDSSSIDKKIIINDSNDTSYKITKSGIKINTDLKKLILDKYNKQFSLFGNKGIIQNYILNILETEYNSIVFHGCSLINDDNEIIIGIGGSGSGKSVLINTALQKGWKLISTEQTIISSNMYIHKGNIYDNVSPLSEKLVEEKLNDAVVLKDKRLVEPIGQKIFVDLTKYQMIEDKVKINFDKLTIVNVNFNGKGESINPIEDSDYLLRLLQSTSSEKISSPTIIRNDLINFPYNGNPELRQTIINKLINSSARKILLSNGFEGFNLFFEKFGG